MTEQRLLHWEMLELHCTVKFLEDRAATVSPGNHLTMEATIDPCRAGCQPAIREVVSERGCSAEYISTDRVFKFYPHDGHGGEEVGG